MTSQLLIALMLACGYHVERPNAAACLKKHLDCVVTAGGYNVKEEREAVAIVGACIVKGGK